MMSPQEILYIYIQSIILIVFSHEMVGSFCPQTVTFMQLVVGTLPFREIAHATNVMKFPANRIFIKNTHIKMFCLAAKYGYHFTKHNSNYI